MRTKGTAIVTGAGIRIGRAIAIHLSKKGYNIALHYNKSRLDAEECVGEVSKAGVKVIAYPFDFNKVEKLPLLFQQIVNDFSDINLLVNSASIFKQGTIESTNKEILSSTININLIAPFILIREYKRFINKGQIINILDQRISKNIPSYSAYSISKVGLAHLTTLAAVELGGNIRVNGIAPGLIMPNTNKDIEYFVKRGKEIPLKRTGDINSITRGVDYLLENDFVNGEILYIDGGESKGSLQK